MRKIVVASVALAILAAAFSAGYAAHQNRVFPLRPFVKRVLIEAGVPSNIIEMIRAGEVSGDAVSGQGLRLDASYYELEGTIYDLPGELRYGGLATLGDSLIHVDGAGLVWGFEEGRFVLLDAQRVPTLVGEGAGDADPSDFDFAGVKDVLRTASYLYASSTDYDVGNDCVRLSINRREIESDGHRITRFGAWQKVFSTDPCLPAFPDEGMTDMIEAGGRMIELADGGVMFTVGGYGKDGVNGPDLAQDPAASYGKTFRLDPADLSVALVSTGHRNPQGLVRLADGRILSTEHGPRGGDELNLIREGRNYGWPLVTFGTDYDSHEWPIDQSAKDHAGYEKPLYAWFPSIGVSQLVQIDTPELPEWDGDLLVSSLYDVSLYRIKLDGDRVMLVERIYVGSRIRDIVNYGGGIALQIDQENKLIVLKRKRAEVS